MVSIWKAIWRVMWTAPKAAPMPTFKTAKLAGKTGWATTEWEFMALKSRMAKPMPMPKAAVMPKFQNLKKASRLGWATSEGEMQKLKQSFRAYGRAK